MAEVTDILEYRQRGFGLSDRKRWTGWDSTRGFFRSFKDLTRFTSPDLSLEDEGLSYLVPLEFMK